jgi:phage/plasmid-like protein (TIGR03299 family)
MAHEITETDSLVLRGQRAWHGLGTIINEDLTAVEACERFGLSWSVNAWPVYAKNPLTGEFVHVDDSQANVRMIDTPEGATPSVLGIVGATYQVCQNRELAEFMDALAQTGKVVIETAGSIRGGKRVWFLARSDAYEMNGGDKSYSYLLGSNAHDGSGAIRLDPTDIRVVCKNTLSMVIPGVDGSGDSRLVEPAAITVRHSGELKSKLEAAREALRQYDRIRDRHREVVGRLNDMRIDRAAAMQFFAQRYSETFVVAGEGDDYKTRLRREERMDKAAAAFMVRFSDEVRKFGGATAWLALNAWTGYCQHDLRSTGKSDAEREENRIRSTLFGVGRQRTAVAIADAVSQFVAA